MTEISKAYEDLFILQGRDLREAFIAMWTAVCRRTPEQLPEAREKLAELAAVIGYELPQEYIDRILEGEVIYSVLHPEPKA